MSEQRHIVPLSPSLLPGALATVGRALHHTHYLDGALDALRSAVGAPGADGRAMASMAGEQIEGVAVSGLFGGTSGAGRLHFLVVEPGVRRTGVGRALANAVIAQLASTGARFVLAELPDDVAALPGARELLRAAGFMEESRIDDFFRDGVALAFMRREIEAR